MKKVQKLKIKQKTLTYKHDKCVKHNDNGPTSANEVLNYDNVPMYSEKRLVITINRIMESWLTRSQNVWKRSDLLGCGFVLCTCAALCSWQCACVCLWTKQILQRETENLPQLNKESTGRKWSHCTWQVLAAMQMTTKPELQRSAQFLSVCLSPSCTNLSHCTTSIVRLSVSDMHPLFPCSSEARGRRRVYEREQGHECTQPW